MDTMSLADTGLVFWRPYRGVVAYGSDTKKHRSHDSPSSHDDTVSSLLRLRLNFVESQTARSGRCIINKALSSCESMELKQTGRCRCSCQDRWRRVVTSLIPLFYFLMVHRLVLKSTFLFLGRIPTLDHWSSSQDHNGFY